MIYMTRIHLHVSLLIYLIGLSNMTTDVVSTA